MMNLWCIFRSPLILGAETGNMDAFTLSLLTNDEVLRVNQQGADQRPVRHESKEVVWQSALPDGMAVALFNRSDEKRVVSVRADELGLASLRQARDLWSGEVIPAVENTLAISLPPHGSILLFLKK